jgi:Tfp pilus assembly protein PilF
MFLLPIAYCLLPFKLVFGKEKEDYLTRSFSFHLGNNPMSDRRQPLLFTLVLLLLFACPALAQRDRDSYVSGVSIEIAGQVKLPDGGPPARNITVRLERFSGGILDQMAVDGLGKFRFSNLQRGYYTVYVSAPGYKQTRQQVDLQVVMRTYLVFELAQDKSDADTNSAASVIDARVPPEAQAEYAKGNADRLDKKTKDALQHLKKAVSLYPEFFEAQFLLSAVYMDALQWEDAEAALRRALEIKPESATVLFSLGEVYRRQKRYVDAEKLLHDGLKLEETSWQGHFTLAHVYWDKAEILKAAPHVGRTIQLKSDYADAHLLAGNIFVRLNLLDRALPEYEDYLRLAPKGEAAEQTRQLVQKIKKALPAEKK